MQYKKIAFIGAGNMAQAIITGLIAHGYPPNLITATAPTDKNLALLRNKFSINTATDNINAAQHADVIVLAVKPQLLEQAISPFKQHFDLSNKLIISLAAGVTISRLEQLLSPKSAIVRIMPNTPSMIGEGMAGLFAKKSVSEDDRRFSEQLMLAVGKICWVEKEHEINHIIAVAGSSPAYFYLFMQAMQEYACELGFSEQQARLLVQQAAIGASKMAVEHPEQTFAQLREQVTSKRGTTAEAIAVFEKRHLTDIVKQAMQAAIIRAEEMERSI